MCLQVGSNLRVYVPSDQQSNAVPLNQRLQLPNQPQILAIYAVTLLMYTVASQDPDPDSRGGGQLPNPNECNFTLTSATRGETQSPKPNECNSTLTSGTGDIYPLHYIWICELRNPVCGVRQNRNTVCLRGEKTLPLKFCTP